MSFYIFSSHLAASSWNWVVLKCFDPLQETHLVQWIGNNDLYIHSVCLEINFADQNADPGTGGVHIIQFCTKCFNCSGEDSLQGFRPCLLKLLSALLGANL